MKTSIATYSFTGDMRDKLSAISKAGFSGVELIEEDYVTFDGTVRELGQLIADHGLTVDLFQHVADVEGLPDPLRRRAFNRVERSFDVMQELGANMLLVCSAAGKEAGGDPGRISADLHLLGERAAKRGLRIGYEAVCWARHVSDHVAAWDAVRRADQECVGLVLDSFHSLAMSSEVNAIRKIPGDRIFHVQISDAPRIEMDRKVLSRRFRTMPGEGDLPLLDFACAVAGTGYGGPYGLEIPKGAFHADTSRIVAADAHRSLIALMDRVRRSGPGAVVDLPEIPAPGQIEGFEFVEFTADANEARRLGELLRALGFAPIAQHISKQVTLWRQGEINLVINSEQKGFAHSAYVMHGTTVCDIGFMVGDANATVERARALGANVFSQRRGEGELDIPAIRGVGGTVFHFLDRKSELAEVWDTEFRPLDNKPGTRETGLQRIDHVAETMTHDDMLVWTLFYLSIFDLGRTPTVDVADPGGPVRSRAIASDDGRLRLTLNGVDTHRTFAGRLMDTSSGSAVQHIAFATRDLIATSEILAANGFEALPIPEDYYLNLATWFDIDPAFLASLRARNILYDEDVEGAYLQLYSLPYNDRFFFEIVERRGSYDGYGARNAPYRTAALKRYIRQEHGRHA